MDADRLKSALQSIISERLVIIVGSGLSCAQGLAGMGAIADHLESSFVAELPNELQDEWDRIGPAIKSDGLEPALHRQEPSEALERLIRRRIVDLLVPQELAVIDAAIAGDIVLRFSKLVPCLFRGHQATPIITTNYDRLLEVACEMSNLPVATMFDGNSVGWPDPTESRNAQNRIRQSGRSQAGLQTRHHAIIIKPHGSLDWFLTPSGPRRFGAALSSDRLVVSPGRGKYRVGYDQPFDFHRQQMNEAIDQARRLLVIGYGFNDDHLETHLEPKIRSGTPTAILTQILSGKAQQLAQECRNVIALERVNDEECGVYFESSYETAALPPIWDLAEFVDEVLTP